MPAAAPSAGPMLCTRGASLGRFQAQLAGAGLIHLRRAVGRRCRPCCSRCRRCRSMLFTAAKFAAVRLHQVEEVWRKRSPGLAGRPAAESPDHWTRSLMHASTHAPRPRAPTWPRPAPRGSEDEEDEEARRAGTGRPASPAAGARTAPRRRGYRRHWRTKPARRREAEDQHDEVGCAGTAGARCCPALGCQGRTVRPRKGCQVLARLWQAVLTAMPRAAAEACCVLQLPLLVRSRSRP